LEEYVIVVLCLMVRGYGYVDVEMEMKRAVVTTNQRKRDFCIPASWEY